MTKTMRPRYLVFISLLLFLVGCSPTETPEAQIEYFRSKDGRTSIEESESITLEWKAVNTTSCFIQFRPDDGELSELQPVECEGDQAYSPEATATYTFSALKRDGQTYEQKLLRIIVESTGPDTTPPQVKTTNPADGAGDVSLNTSITLSFSEPMDKVATQGALSISPAVDCAFTWNADADVLECKPKEALTADTAYTATLGIGATDEAGNALDEAVSFVFTTGAATDLVPPEVTAISPSDGATNVPDTTTIKLSFSEPMNQGKTEAAFSADPVISCSFSWNSEATELTCDPVTDLLSGETYTISLGTGAQDLAGNTLDTAYSKSFTTGSAAPAICTFGNAEAKFGSCMFGE